jgi:hypothetical protein
MDAILTFGPPSSILPRASLRVHGRPASLSRLRPRLVPVLSPCAHPPRPRLCPPMGPAHAPPMPRPCPAHAMSRRRRSATLAPLSTALGTGCPWETQNARKTRPDAARRDAGKCAHRGAVLASALRPARCRIAALYPAAFVWTQALAHCLAMHALRFSVLPPASCRCCRCDRNHGLFGRCRRGAVSARLASRARLAARGAAALTRAGRRATWARDRAAGPRRAQGMARAHRAPDACVTSMFRGQEMGAWRP